MNVIKALQFCSVEMQSIIQMNLDDDADGLWFFFLYFWSYSEILSF